MSDAGNKVAIPRWALGVLLGVALVGLLGSAFLLGRQSSAPTVVMIPPATAAPQPSPVAQPSAPSAPAAPSEPAAAPAAPRPADVPPPVAPVAMATPQPERRTDIERYFTELDSNLAMAKSWDDPTQFAHQALNAATTGDTTALKQVRKGMQDGMARVRGMAVPAECQEHHRLVLDTMDKGGKVLSKLEDALSKQELGALTSVASEGEKLKTDSNRADELAAEIKKKHGIR